MLRDDDLSGQFWFDKLNSIGQEIEPEKHDYSIFGNNSNSFISTIIQRSGLGDELTLVSPGFSSGVGSSVPGGSKYTPGWGNILPR